MGVLGVRDPNDQRAASTPTSGEQLVKGDELARPLAHRHLLTVAHEAHPGHEAHLHGVDVEAHRLRRVAHARDRAVVVGAPDIDEVAEARG